MDMDIEAIEKKFNKSQDALVLQQSDLSLKSISDMVESGAIDVSPKYQRRERWSEKKKSDLIESFILNIPVPPIYLAEDAYGTYSVIDGKQRITAIYDYLSGKFRLKDLERFQEIEGATFSNLPTPIHNALKIRPYLRVVTLLKQSDNDLKHEVFLRLNKAGVALNAQEIRNVAFRGKFNDMIIDLAEDDYFKGKLKATEKSKIYREMGDVQYVLRFFAVKKYWKNFPGKMEKAMDDFMKIHFKDGEESVAKHRALFERSLRACEEIWGDSAFTNPKGSKRVLQGFYDVQMVCLSLLNDEELISAIKSSKKVKSALKQLLDKDPEFYSATTQFTSNPENMKLRIERFLAAIKEEK